VTPPSVQTQSKTQPQNFTASLKAVTNNTAEALAKIFNNSGEIFNYSKTVASKIQLKAELKEESGSVLSLTGTYTGAEKLAELVIVFEVPKSFATSSKQLVVVTSANTTVLKEDPLYAIDFANVSAGGSFSVTFRKNSSANLTVVKNDLKSAGVLARTQQMEVPVTLLQAPIVQDLSVSGVAENATNATGNLTWNATSNAPGFSSIVGMVVLGGATLLIMALFAIILLVLALFLITRSPSQKKHRSRRSRL
jgi:hypothetical protein